MSKPAVFSFLPLCITKIVSLFLILLLDCMPALAAHPTSFSDSLSATDYALSELLKAGWRKNAAKAVVGINSQWFTILKREHKNDFHHQIKLLKQLKPEALVSRFLRKHPETAGLLALSANPTRLVKILKKPACYNVLTSFYALHPTPTEVRQLTEALEKHRDTLCRLAERGIVGSETIFMFPRQTRGAKEYDAWLSEVLCKYLQRSDRQLAQITAFLIEQGQRIRQRLDKDYEFYKNFRKNLWPALMRMVDNFSAFQWLANDPHIWELLALPEGEMLLNKWGLGPVSLLFCEGSYPADMRPIITHILLQGDDNTVDALFKYKDEPLFRDLMRRQLSASTQAALANKLANFCPNYPLEVCPDLPHHLRYFASLTENAALAEEVGPPPSGPVTWLPFHGSYYAIKKMTQGREITGEDMLNLGLDALIFVPSVVFAGAFSGAAQPLSEEIIVNIGIIGLDLTPHTYHLVKPLGKFAIRAGNQTSKILTQQLANKMTQKAVLLQGNKIIIPNANTPVAAVMAQSQQMFSRLGQQGTKPVSYEATKPILFITEKALHQGHHAMRLVEFEAKVFMRYDTKTVMNPTRGLGEQFFSETAQKALSAPATRPTNRKNSAWQQNISAWWLMNAALGYW
ncbi:MAG: hypothetical protein B6247_07005 [Candidatus Parabeggiatoa sp. nov. 2]|nr:MAG: hypothetical protein B6247_07005 [Beggiatoa sp. 4572_84]